jgi:lactoylglutathione lyase
MDKSMEKSAWPGEIFAITLFVEDVPAAKQFYVKVFGLPVFYEDPDSTVFKFGNTMVNLLKNTAVAELIEPAKMSSHDTGHRLVFTIQVEDVDAKCAELNTLGVKLLNGPMDRPWGIRTASFIDPAGYIWEIAKT